MSSRIALVIAGVVALLGIGALSTSYVLFRASQDGGFSSHCAASMGDDRNTPGTPAMPVPSPSKPETSVAEDPIARALVEAGVAPTSVQMIIPVKPTAYFIVAQVGPVDERQIQELYVDLENHPLRMVTLVAQRFVGPAPQYTYMPYDLFTDQLHVRTVDAWEGLSITHDDYIDVKTGKVLALVSTYNRYPTMAVVSDTSASTTIEYVYDKTQCARQKDDGKKVAVTGVRVNGTRVIAFRSPVEAVCGYSELFGEADLAVGFLSEGYRVNPEGMVIRTAWDHSLVIPVNKIGDTNAVLLDP